MQHAKQLLIERGYYVHLEELKSRVHREQVISIQNFILQNLKLHEYLFAFAMKGILTSVLN